MTILRICAFKKFPVVILLACTFWSSAFDSVSESVLYEYRVYPLPQLPLGSTHDDVLRGETEYNPSNIYLGIRDAVLPGECSVVEYAASDPIVNVVKEYYSYIKQDNKAAFASLVRNYPNWNVDFGFERLRLMEYFEYIPGALLLVNHMQVGPVHFCGVAISGVNMNHTMQLGVVESEQGLSVRSERDTVDRLVDATQYSRMRFPSSFLPVASSIVEEYKQFHLNYDKSTLGEQVYPINLHINIHFPEWGRIVIRDGNFVVDALEHEHTSSIYYDLVRFYRDSLAVYTDIQKDESVSLSHPKVLSYLSRLTEDARLEIVQKASNESVISVGETTLWPLSQPPTSNHEVVAIIDSDPYFYVLYTDTVVTESYATNARPALLTGGAWLCVVRQGDTFRFHNSSETGGIDLVMHDSKVMNMIVESVRDFM